LAVADDSRLTQDVSDWAVINGVGFHGFQEGPAMDRQPVSEVPVSHATVSRRTLLSRCAALPLAAALLTSCSGCQIVIGVMQIFQGFPKTPNEFSVNTNGRSLAEKGKRVLVLSTSTPSAQSENGSLDLDIMAEVSRAFTVSNINVVSPDKVGRWIDDRGQINLSTEIEPIAKAFKADFVVLFTFEEFGYQEENSPGLHRGHANGRIVVTELVDDKTTKTKKRARVIYNRPFTTKYPLNHSISADQEGPDLFKRKFMAQLSQFLTRKFVDYRPEDEIQ
jgi:hypothetical protein